MNAPLTLEELGEAVGALANHKCPGLDGTPNEFYKANWTVVGPLVLRCISLGINQRSFPEPVTRGAIVLLPKKADQRLLSNKRPITLLNSIYKIGAKAMQLRITPILQRTLSSQQTAFLPGRNIHHGLLQMAKMLHRAKELGENHILLKLDVWKAFDRISWPFLLAIVEKAGMSGVLSSFLEASFYSASSLIILNGRPTNSFKLTRSVRQGCPLSPLLFNVAFDALSLMLNRAVANKFIIGVDFPELELSTLQTMFADNLTMIIKAAMIYVLRCKQILLTFGVVSGLKCLWEQTVAAFIPD